MNRRSMLKLVSVGLSIIALLFVLTAGASKDGTITVKEGQSIQEAINSATPGDTILIEPGTYKENLKVDKSLTLKSSGEVAKTIIEPKDPSKDLLVAESPEGEPLIEHVVVKGLTFQNGEKSGIVLTGKNHLIINNVVRDIANHCVIPIGGGQVVITKNKISNCRKTGIFLWGTPNVAITKNEITECKTAIEMTEGAKNAEIHYNNIIDSWVFGIKSKVEVNARLNWWGEDVDPSGWVSQTVKWEPMLNAPYPEGIPTYRKGEGE